MTSTDYWSVYGPDQETKPKPGVYLHWDGEKLTDNSGEYVMWSLDTTTPSTLPRLPGPGWAVQRDGDTIFASTFKGCMKWISEGEQ